MFHLNREAHNHPAEILRRKPGELTALLNVRYSNKKVQQKVLREKREIYYC